MTNIVVVVVILVVVVIYLLLNCDIMRMHLLCGMIDKLPSPTSADIHVTFTSRQQVYMFYLH